MVIVLKIFFLTLSNANILFVEQKIIQRFYTTVKALQTTKQIKIRNKKKFTKTILNKNMEAFVIYVISLSLS